MKNSRRWTLVAALFLTVSACRGTGGYTPQSLPASAFQRNAGASISFVALGPTQMTWLNSPAESGKVNAFAANPRDPRVMYVGSGAGTGLETYSSAGLYKTTDGGVHWAPLTNGLVDGTGFIVSTINALWIDPHNPSVLVAATEYDGLYRSADAGASWKNVADAGRSAGLLQFDGTLYAATAAGILASADDGSTWTTSLRGSPSRYPTAFGAAGSALYAGMTDGGIFSYGSGTWTKAGTLPYHAYGYGGGSPAVHQIAVDPYAPQVVYANANDGNWDQILHASTDGGHTWNTLFKGKYLRDLGTQTVAFSLAHPHRLYIGEDGALFYTAGDGSSSPKMHAAARLQIVDLRNVWVTGESGGDDVCWIASDQGLDRVPACSIGARGSDHVATGSMNVGLTRHIALDPTGKTILVSLQDFEGFLSANGGSSWRPQNQLDEDVFPEIDPANPRLCYTLNELQLLVSRDGCATFRIPPGLATSIGGDRLFTNPLAIDPMKPSRLYLTAMKWTKNLYSFKPLVLETEDAGKSFTALPGKFSWPGLIQVDAHDDRHLIVGDLVNESSSALFATFDAGKHWVKAAGVPATRFWYGATISPVDGKTVLAMNVDAANNVYILRSADGGLHFHRVATLTNAPFVRAPLPESDVPIIAPNGKPDFVYSPSRELRFNDAVRSGTPDVVATTVRGAFLSTDLGATWRRIDGSLIAHSFWGTRWLNGYLYLATDGQGVVRSTSPLQ